MRTIAIPTMVNSGRARRFRRVSLVLHGERPGRGARGLGRPCARNYTSVSAKPHLVSGGDALIRIAVPEGAPVSAVTVSVDETDVTYAFREEPRRRALLGLVTGLRNGKNRVAARLAAHDGDSGALATHLDLTNYPVTGPMISGPTRAAVSLSVGGVSKLVTGELLDPPLDANCSVATRVDYVYRATDGTFKPLRDLAGSPPDDLTQTTTTGGHTVPFIVRVETGTVNRAIYEIAMLHDPSEPVPNPWTRSPGWKRQAHLHARAAAARAAGISKATGPVASCATASFRTAMR